VTLLPFSQSFSFPNQTFHYIRESIRSEENVEANKIEYCCEAMEGGDEW
jgi:hypothetical protein